MKKNLPIEISAHLKSWRMLDVHADETDQRYQEIRQQILQRDAFICQFCSFRSEKYQEIHHLDHDHGHNALKNLVTACPFCHMCFHLAMAGIRRAGTIIWCPEHTQAQLNNLTRAIFIAIENKGVHEETARILYAELESRSSPIEEYLYKEASDPANFAQAFINMSEENKSTLHQRLHGLRLLPKPQAFSRQISYWQTEGSTFGELKDKKWDVLVPMKQDNQARIDS